GSADDGAVPADPSVAGFADHRAVTAEPSMAVPAEYRRLLAPDAADRRAAALLRHPDLLAPVADLHRAQLLARLDAGSARAA
ncbi:hypothetical protein J7I94_30905, partial [Streptomyces sp. ISL-12]|nr:hypothetical protein [Streptomyces sp. ISL-12]